MNSDESKTSLSSSPTPPTGIVTNENPIVEVWDARDTKSDFVPTFTNSNYYRSTDQMSIGSFPSVRVIRSVPKRVVAVNKEKDEVVFDDNTRSLARFTRKVSQATGNYYRKGQDIEVWTSLPKDQRKLKTEKNGEGGKEEHAWFLARVLYHYFKDKRIPELDVKYVMDDCQERVSRVLVRHANRNEPFRSVSDILALFPSILVEDQQAAQTNSSSAPNVSNGKKFFKRKVGTNNNLELVNKDSPPPASPNPEQQRPMYEGLSRGSCDSRMESLIEQFSLAYHKKDRQNKATMTSLKNSLENLSTKKSELESELKKTNDELEKVKERIKQVEMSIYKEDRVLEALLYSLHGLRSKLKEGGREPEKCSICKHYMNIQTSANAVFCSKGHIHCQPCFSHSRGRCQICHVPMNRPLYNLAFQVPSGTVEHSNDATMVWDVPASNVPQPLLAATIPVPHQMPVPMQQQQMPSANLVYYPTPSGTYFCNQQF